MTMTWEAFRLTSKSPADVYQVLGPHGVDDLIRKALDAVWREYPEQSRTYENVKKRMLEVYGRNMKHWSSIRKPTPQSFFENLLPYTADGHVRQALVLAWMMMPRTGGRKFADVKQIVAEVFERNMAAWDRDNATFTTPAAKIAAKKKPAPPKKPGKKATPAAKKPAATLSGVRKSAQPTSKAASRKSKRK